MKEWEYISGSEEATQSLGKALGEICIAGTLILLQGDLGAGKSVFARGVARGLGVDNSIPITSPTFTLMNHYEGHLDLYHFDLYRLSDADELIEIGFDDYAYGRGVALVEWPDKMEDDHAAALWLTIARIDQTQRRLSFLATDEHHQQLLQCLIKQTEL